MARVKQLTRFAAFVLGIAALFAIVFLWMGPKHQTSYRPECPLTSITVHDSETRAITHLLHVAIAGNQSLVPEFNDCQRFVNTTENGYGPLVGIFASQQLNSQIEHMYVLAGGTTGAVAVALITNFTGPTYTDLGISASGQGFNCLYMWAIVARGDTSRKARIIPVRGDTDCVADVSLDSVQSATVAAPVLEVQLRRPKLDYVGPDYPQVARWDWDPKSKTQYIGIGCETGWCEIGKGPFSPSSAYDAGQTTPKKQRRVLEVKGWYDEEALAVKGASGTLVPSGVVGTLVADPDLDDLHVADFATWKRVATVALSGPLPSYENKLNLQVAPVNSRTVNTIELCKGDPTQCRIPSGVNVDLTACKTAPDHPWQVDNYWYARITSSQTHRQQYRCVLRREHPGLAIPGIVRWRWKEDDQVGWIKCDAGCCEVTGIH